MTFIPDLGHVALTLWVRSSALDHASVCVLVSYAELTCIPNLGHVARTLWVRSGALDHARVRMFVCVFV